MNEELKELILHYRDTGQRVDEVLYHAVIMHIERSEKVEEYKQSFHDGLLDEVTENVVLLNENKRYREALERLLKEAKEYKKNGALIEFLVEALEEESE